MSRKSATASKSRRKPSEKLREAREAMYRQHIMDCAERMFATAGYDAVKMQEVATQSGISLGTLYGSFPSKESLYRAILVERDQQMVAAVDATASSMPLGPTGVADLLNLLEVPVRFFMNHPDYLKMQLLAGHLWYSSASRPSREEQAIFVRGFERLVRAVEWAISSKHFIAGRPDDLARMILVLQQTRLANWVLADMKAPPDEVVAIVQGDFVRMFCTPLRAAELLDGDGVTRRVPGQT
jgi:AcrR family transcriptional regulator